jgi:hypothetical protein
MTLCFRQAKGEAYASLPWAAGRACSCDEGARWCKGLPCSPRPPSPARASPASVCGASRADGQAPKQVIGGWREKAITCFTNVSLVSPFSAVTPPREEGSD